jgi:hypothetical protein
MAQIAMKISDWAENLRVAIIGAGNFTACIKGSTTCRPPYRDGDCTRVEILDDDGHHRYIALSRVRINSKP